jgi:hypothetical protein
MTATIAMAAMVMMPTAATDGDDVDDDNSGISSTAIGGGERPERQATRRDNQPNERGATRGGGVMRGGGKAKAPDNVTQRNATTNEWRGVKRGGGAGCEAEGGHRETRQPTEQVGRNSVTKGGGAS